MKGYLNIMLNAGKETVTFMPTWCLEVFPVSTHTFSVTSICKWSHNECLREVSSACRRIKWKCFRSFWNSTECSQNSGCSKNLSSLYVIKIHSKHIGALQISLDAQTARCHYTYNRWFKSPLSPSGFRNICWNTAWSVVLSSQLRLSRGLICWYHDSNDSLARHRNEKSLLTKQANMCHQASSNFQCTKRLTFSCSIYVPYLFFVHDSVNIVIYRILCAKISIWYLPQIFWLLDMRSLW